MASYSQVINDLRSISRLLEANGGVDLRASDERALVEVVAMSGTPQEILHVWALALELCWLANTDEPLSPFRRMVVAIGQELIGESWANAISLCRPQYAGRARVTRPRGDQRR